MSFAGKTHTDAGRAAISAGRKATIREGIAERRLMDAERGRARQAVVLAGLPLMRANVDRAARLLDRGKTVNEAAIVLKGGRA